jgi:two-component system nitrogen regulation sensor histidine kinase GlnL
MLAAMHTPLDQTSQRVLLPLDALGTPLALCDAGGRVLWVNAALDELAGARRWIGMSLTDAAAQPALEELLERVRRTARPALERALNCSLAGAEGLLHDIRIAPIELAGLAPGHYLVELTALRSSQANLGSAFGRMVAHEVRNPLGAIAGAAQLLGRAKLDAGQGALVRLILEETARIDALVDQLQSGQVVAERQPTNIHRVLEHVRQLARAEFGELLVMRDYDPSIPAVQLDYQRLVQALLNLLRNAAQAGASRVILRSRVEHRQRLGGLVHRQALRIEVEDNGPGVAEELRERLTLPGVSGRPDGSGLGLAVVDAIAREHAGQLSYDSEPGRTRFVLRMPLESRAEG